MRVHTETQQRGGVDRRGEGVQDETTLLHFPMHQETTSRCAATSLACSGCHKMHMSNYVWVKTHAYGDTRTRTSGPRFERRMIHKKGKEDEDEDERVVVPPVSCNLHPATAGAATAGAATEVLRQQVLRQRVGGGTSPRRGRLLAAPKDRGAHAQSRMFHRQQLHQVVVTQGDTACSICSEAICSNGIPSLPKKPCATAKRVSAGPRTGGRWPKNTRQVDTHCNGTSTTQEEQTEKRAWAGGRAARAPDLLMARAETRRADKENEVQDALPAGSQQHSLEPVRALQGVQKHSQIGWQGDFAGRQAGTQRAARQPRARRKKRRRCGERERGKRYLLKAKLDALRVVQHTQKHCQTRRRAD